MVNDLHFSILSFPCQLYSTTAWPQYTKSLYGTHPCLNLDVVMFLCLHNIMMVVLYCDDSIVFVITYNSTFSWAMQQWPILLVDLILERDKLDQSLDLSGLCHSTTALWKSEYYWFYSCDFLFLAHLFYCYLISQSNGWNKTTNKGAYT